MGDTFCDATQSYENETNTASTIITNISNDDLLTPPEFSDANNLIKLVNDAPTNTNNLYILQANTNGEIRFLTKEAYLNNDVSANDGNLYYNTKIGKDGKLYLYWTYNFIKNPARFSGWYDIGEDVAEHGFQLTLLETGFAGVEIQLITINTNITTLFSNVALLNTEIVQINTEIGALATQTGIFQELFTEINAQIYGNRSRVIAGFWTRLNWKNSAEILRQRFTARQVAGRLGNVMSPSRTLTSPQLNAFQMISNNVGVAINKAVGDIGTTLAVIGGGVILAGIYRYYSNAATATKDDVIKDLLETKEDMILQQANTPNSYYTTANRIAELGLSVNVGTQGNYTGAIGFYEVSLATSPNNSTDGYIVIEIYLVSTVKTARISKVLSSGTRAWAVGNTISIDKQTDLGGWDNAGTRYLLLNINTVYSPLQAIDLIINSVLAEQPEDDRRSRRRSGVIGIGEYDTSTFTTVSATETNTDTNEIITYSTLKSRLNLLPTGGGDVDIYTATGSLGIGTTPLTNIDTYHISDNILRLGTATNGKNSIEFKRGTDLDVYTDFRLMADISGYFKLQYEDDALAYGDTGTDIIWGSKEKVILQKDTEIVGKVGVGTTPSTDAGITLHTYHASSQIMRLATADTGTTELQFTRGAVADDETDYRFISDTDDAFKLQYRDDVVSYTNLINIIPTEINLLKNTKITGNVGIGTSALTNLHIYGATANTLLLETGATGLPIIEFRKATTTDTNTDYRFISDAGGIFKFQFNNNITSFGATANASDIWNARVDRMVIYKNTTITANCGIGGANPHATYKLNVGGDINIPEGSIYRIGTNPLSYNDLTDQLVSGANITIDGNVINCAPPNTLADDIEGIVSVEHGGTGRNDIGMYAIPFGTTDESTYAWTGNFKYNPLLGRLGVNVFTPEYALDVNGDMNIPLTSNYRIGGNPLSYNDLANKLTAGTNIDITSGVISATVPTQLTAGTGITITGGAINATTQLSAGTNITITSGVISATVPAQLTAGTNITITGGAINATVPTTFDAGAITSGTLALSRGGTGTTTIGANGTIPYGNATQNGYTWNNLFKFDAVNTRLAINKGTPLYTLDVGGDINIPTGTFYRVNGTALTFTNLSGTCPVSKGGTGITVASVGAIIFGNATSTAYSYRVVFNWDDTNLRLGVNKTTPLYTIDSGGDINIPTGSSYRINGTALSYNDLTNQLTAGTNVSIVSGAINASITSISASAITSGTLGVDRGGTGNATITSGNILYGNGTSAIGNNTSFKYLLGCLGVNMTGNPVTTLHIGTGGLATAGTYYVWFDYFSGSSLGFTNSNRTGVCAYLQGSLWLAGGRFIASSSDVRIKHEIEDINDDSALQMILAVEPKTYKYLDKLAMGNKKVYGFIAQQIKEVIPNAINIQKEIIPNIMLLADYNESIITLPSLPSAVIKVGDKVRCYDKRCKEIIAVVEEVIDTLTFKLAPLGEGQTPPYIDNDNKIFIYGTEIDDFHTIDKNYIYTLNVCATQELHRKIVSQEQRIAELEAKVERLLNYLT